MDYLKRKIAKAIRWGWFGFLVLLAFSYLVAGLSNPTRPHQPDPSTAGVDELEVDRFRSTGEYERELDSAVTKIDKVWLASLQEQGLQAAPEADWMTISRRMSLAFVGNGLSLEEIRQLEQLPESERANKHLENLLDDSRFHHYWAERWSRFLVGTDGGQFVLYRRRRFRIWLADVFAANWTYDRIVRRLITAEGIWTDSPEVNFLTATFDSNDGQPDPVRLAARASRAFLGLRIDCLQCHDDFLGNVSLGDIEQPREGLQTDFHQLAAFFTSAKTGLRGVKDGQPNYKYKYLDAEEEVDVKPAVPYSPELLPEKGNARQRLAKWITHPENRQAARSAVSHVYALIFGRAAGESVDNLPLDDTWSPVMEAFVDDFVEHAFDVRRLIRVITRSAVFRVDSRADFDVTLEHEQAGAVFPLVRLRPEQMAGSIIQSGRVKAIDRDSAFFLQLQQFGGINDFVKRYGDIGEDEFSTDSATIPQRLVMLNGKMLREIINRNPVLNTSAHIDMFAKDDAHAVETIYLCLLNRYPTDVERTLFVDRMSTADSRGRAIEDMCWILLNSTELSWNH